MTITCSSAPQVFAGLIEGHASEHNYEINGHQYTKRVLPSRRYLSKVVDICEDNLWATRSEKSQFISRQESCRKYVEQTFGML
jgi:hypothetical protein